MRRRAGVERASTFIDATHPTLRTAAQVQEPRKIRCYLADTIQRERDRFRGENDGDSLPPNTPAVWLRHRIVRASLGAWIFLKLFLRCRAVFGRAAHYLGGVMQHSLLRWIGAKAA